MTDAEKVADAVLRASGSALHMYSLPSVRKAIVDAAEEAMDSARSSGIHAAAAMLEDMQHSFGIFGPMRHAAKVLDAIADKSPCPYPDIYDQGECCGGLCFRKPGPPK